MDLIIGKACKQRESSSIACMRLVSKSWLAAVTAFSGAVKSLRIEEQEDLLRLCKVLPNTVSLEIDSEIRELRLDTLSALSKLTSFRLEGSLHRDPRDDISVDISGLPNNLRKLDLHTVHVLPACFGSLNLENVSSLSFIASKTMNPELWKLLQHLPRLEVICSSFLRSIVHPALNIEPDLDFARKA